MTRKHEDLHYRLFAKLLMFLTLLLGGAIGYFTGVTIGEERAKELIYEGLTLAQTSDDSATIQKTALAACMKTKLGAVRFAEWEANATLTLNEISTILTCQVPSRE